MTTIQKQITGNLYCLCSQFTHFYCLQCQVEHFIMYLAHLHTNIYTVNFHTFFFILSLCLYCQFTYFLVYIVYLHTWLFILSICTLDRLYSKFMHFTVYCFTLLFRLSIYTLVCLYCPFAHLTVYISNLHTLMFTLLIYTLSCLSYQFTHFYCLHCQLPPFIDQMLQVINSINNQLISGKQGMPTGLSQTDRMDRKTGT